MPIKDYDKRTADHIAGQLKGFSQREVARPPTNTEHRIGVLITAPIHHLPTSGMQHRRRIDAEYVYLP